MAEMAAGFNTVSKWERRELSTLLTRAGERSGQTAAAEQDVFRTGVYANRRTFFAHEERTLVRSPNVYFADDFSRQGNPPPLVPFWFGFADNVFR